MRLRVPWCHLTLSMTKSVVSTLLPAPPPPQRVVGAGDFQNDLTDDVDEFGPDEAKSLIDWLAFFKKVRAVRERPHTTRPS